MSWHDQNQSEKMLIFYVSTKYCFYDNCDRVVRFFFNALPLGFNVLSNKCFFSHSLPLHLCLDLFVCMCIQLCSL